MAIYQFPVANRGSWLAGVDVGVTGGIAQYQPGGASERTNLIDVTSYGADPTGVVGSSAAFAAAIAASSPGDVIWLPNGTYWNDLGVGFAQGVNNRSFRGESRAGVIIECETLTGFGLGTGGTFTGNEQTVTGTKTQGTSVLSVFSSAAYAVGQLVRVVVENEEDVTRIQAGADPTFSARGFRDVRHYPTIVTAVGSGTITIATPLPWDATFLTLKIFNMDGLASWRLERVGLENLTIRPRSGESMTYGVQMQYCVECWMDNCDVTCTTGTSSSELKISDSYRCELRRSRFHDSNASSDGKLQFSSVSRCLIEDNNFDGTSAAFYNSGNTVENAFSANFAVECDTSFLTAHNAGPCLDYFENNIGSFLVHADHYHGNSVRINFFRNWLTAANPELTGGAVVPLCGALKRFARSYAFAGNVFGVDGLITGLFSLGNPNIGNSDYNGTSDMTAGDFPADWLLQATLTSRTSDEEAVFTMDSSIGQLFEGQGNENNGPCIWWNSYGNARISLEVLDITGLQVTLGASGFEGGDVMPAVSTVVTFWTGTHGYQELDLAVEGTMILDHNFRATAEGDGEIENPLTGGDTLPESHIHSSKPAFFGDLDWPALGPDIPLTSLADYGRIPAGVRWLETVPETAPEFESDVVISGSGSEGSEITVTGGIASGNPTPTYTFQLQINDGGGWDDVFGATAAPFTFPAYTAPGYLVRMAKTATNSVDPFTDVSYSNEIELLPFMGDIFTPDTTANTDPVADVWKRKHKVTGDVSYLVVRHSLAWPQPPPNSDTYDYELNWGNASKDSYTFEDNGEPDATFIASCL